jgi:GT2 family glycosyltransferase
MTEPLISLVVLGYRNFDSVTRHCLDSLQPWFADPDIEVIALDNGSTDGSAEKLAQWCTNHPTVRCLLSPENKGFAGGMNWGASHVRGQWILLVNNDTIFPMKALDALKRVLTEVPSKVAMVGPITNAAGNGQRLWKPEADHAQWLALGAGLHENPTHQLMPTYRCDFFCIAIRHDVWKNLSGLDLDFGLGYYEDFDFSLRLRNAGFMQMITEDVFVLHAGSATFAGSAQARALIKRNKKLLKSKHPYAKFEHTRLGNLAVLSRYKELHKAGLWTPALQAREVLRLGALRGDAPRSKLKRWLWNYRVRHFLRKPS